jgi:hypothetical protein
MTDPFERAKALADAVLFEGYVLYPYRASAKKNQLRWQFGVVAPRPFCEIDPSEDWATQTQCLLEAGADPVLDVKVRFLRVQERRVEQSLDPDGATFTAVASLEVGEDLLSSWDEAVEEEIDLTISRLRDIVEEERVLTLDLPVRHQVETLRDAEGNVIGRVARELQPTTAVVRVFAQPVDGPYPLVIVGVRVENTTPWSGAGDSASRDEVMRRSLAAVHTLLAVRGGAFISLFDPPEFASGAVKCCVNLHTWPVLIGDPGARDVVLSSPVTLYDYAEVAPESEGDFFDSTEIDEMLALRVMTLTDEEKREARGTDARAAAILDRVDDMPDEIMDRLHGAVRYLKEGPARSKRSEPAPVDSEAPFWDPGMDASVNPAEDRIWIGPVQVGRGSEVRLRPWRKADAQDLFLKDREATVQAVLHDVDGNTHLAVTVGDAEETELAQWHGRYLYFYPDEVEPLVPQAADEAR